MFKQYTKFLTAAIFISLFLFSNQLFAHTINYQLEKAPVNDVISFYLKLGYQHILPEGFDHILFVVGLCLLSTKIKTIIWQATAFTVAHSITLALCMKNLVVAPSAIVEPIIALSLLFRTTAIFFTTLLPRLLSLLKMVLKNTLAISMNS